VVWDADERFLMAKSQPTSIYEFRSTFRAPLPFVFDWCTDYSPEDPTLEKDEYTRRILSRKPRQVVYEDLSDTPNGWLWSRQVVSLHPPNRWHAEATGNHRAWSLDYELVERPRGVTELRFRGVRRATFPGERNPPKARLERELRQSWKNFGRALERDFRAHKRSTKRKGR
jgi:hypothetical protein